MWRICVNFVMFLNITYLSYPNMFAFFSLAKKYKKNITYIYYLYFSITARTELNVAVAGS